MPSDFYPAALGLLISGLICFPLTLRLVMGQRYVFATFYWLLCAVLGTTAHVCLLLGIAALVGTILLVLVRPAPTAQFAQRDVSSWPVPAKIYLAFALLQLAVATAWIIFIVWAHPEA